MEPQQAPWLGIGESRGAGGQAGGLGALSLSPPRPASLPHCWSACRLPVPVVGLVTGVASLGGRARLVSRLPRQQQRRVRVVGLLGSAAPSFMLWEAGRPGPARLATGRAGGRLP